MNLGIDLGTTYSLCARLEPDGRPTLLPDQTLRDEFHTPSVVHIADHGALVGHLVEMLIEREPSLPVIRFFKRRFGNTSVLFYDAARRAWYPETIAALVMKKLLLDAESYTGNRPTAAVVTVPAHFDDKQRRSVLAAAGLADIEVLGLLDEPIAAALHYGVVHNMEEQVLLVYDFGGGTFDVSVVNMDHDTPAVLAKDGLTELGGKDFDDRVAEMILDQFKRAGVELSDAARSSPQLRRLAEDVKIELCEPNRSLARRVAVLGGHSVEVHVSRRDFECAIMAAIDETEAVTRRCIEGAGLSLSDVGTFLLVGGSSWVPAVAERMRRLFGQRVLHHEPMKAIAFGAAIRSAQLNGDAERYRLPPELRGVTGYYVGIRTLDPLNGRARVDCVIKKNMPLPFRAERTYFTNRPNQSRMMLEIVQYRENPNDTALAGRLEVELPPTAPLNHPIDVTLEIEENGTLGVRAYDPGSGAEYCQRFRRDDETVFANLATQHRLVRSTMINNL